MENSEKKQTGRSTKWRERECEWERERVHTDYCYLWMDSHWLWINQRIEYLTNKIGFWTTWINCMRSSEESLICSNVLSVTQWMNILLSFNRVTPRLLCFEVERLKRRNRERINRKRDAPFFRVHCRSVNLGHNSNILLLYLITSLDV